MADNPKLINVEVKWDGLDDYPIAPSNLVLAQFTHAEFTLTFGYATPNVVTDASGNSVRAKPVARLSLSPQRMREFIDVLKTNLEQFEKMQIASQTQGGIKH